MKRYSLEALRGVREHQVDEKRQRLAERNTELQRVQVRAAAASEALTSERAARQLIAEQEQLRAAAGVARAGDFQRVAHYQVGATKREQVLFEAVKREHQALAVAEQERNAAEQAVAAARADAKVIERHHSESQSKQARLQEDELEEAAQEVWGGVHHRRGPDA
ncbi:MAG: hypothetical protein RJA70_1059 [Pseudomonadota bacterium]